MASTSVKGYNFDTTPSGSVIVTGPGIQGSGIDLGDSDTLSPSRFSRAMTSPNVDEAAAKALREFSLNPGMVMTVQKNLATEEPKPDEKAGQKIDEKPAAAPTKESDNKAKDDAAPKSGTTVPGSGNKPVTASQAAESSKVKSALAPDSGIGKRTWNPLGDFSSYTYRVSLYSMPPEAINHYNQTGSWFKNDLYLICQSGGINSNPKQDAQRAPGFELDYFIDDVEYTTSINSKDLQQSSNSTHIRFKVVEPYGATFPQKLVDAQRAISEKSKFARPVNSTNEALWGHYLISFTFYGYDVDGKIINPDKYNLAGKTSTSLDENGVFERSFPVYIDEFTFRLDGKGQIYSIGTFTINTAIGLGTKRGEISTELSAQGRTVEEVLGGGGKTTEGLIDELNKRSNASKGTDCEIPDQYAIAYESNSTIKTATLVSENLNKDRTPMVPVQGAGGSNVVKSSSAASASMIPKRTIKISGGTPIVQAIDQIISQSSYISESLKVVESEAPQPVREGDPTATDNAKAKPLQWYIILPVTEVIGFDKLRNDYAYKITYVVKSYDIPYVRSDSIDYVPKYPGAHKIYNYWYTGKNSEVISYEQNNNTGYFLYLGEQSKQANKDKSKSGVRYQAKPVNNADSTGKAPGSFEGANSIKAFLYSPDDLNEAKISILGDPDFLMTSTSGTLGQTIQEKYGQNFTINPNSGQVFIEVIFNQTEDYSHQSGTLPVLQVLDFHNFTNNPNPGAQALVKGTVFMVQTVVSKFNNGKFTQDFTVSLPNFKDVNSNDFSSSAAPGSSTGTDRETSGKATTPSSIVAKGNATAATQARLGLPQSTGSAGGGRGGQGGPSVSQSPHNKFSTVKGVSVLPSVNSKPNDDELFIASGNKKIESGREQSATGPYKR